METATLAIFGLPGGSEWIVIVLIALLIFGRRLPDVARSVGKSIVEFKKGVRDVKDDIEVQSRLESSANSKLEQKPETSNDAPAASEASRERSAPSS
jgi:sec-independent protein translocase protein TatA